MKDNIKNLIIVILVATLLTFVLLSDTKTNYLEKENETLRNELNIKNGDNWEKQIQQNMKKDQPIFY